MVISASNNFLCHRKSILKSDPKGKQFAFAEEILLKILSSRVESKASFFFSMFISDSFKEKQFNTIKNFLCHKSIIGSMSIRIRTLSKPPSKESYQKFSLSDKIHPRVESKATSPFPRSNPFETRFLSSLRKGKQFFVKKC